MGTWRKEAEGRFDVKGGGTKEVDEGKKGVTWWWWWWYGRGKTGEGDKGWWERVSLYPFYTVGRFQYRCPNECSPRHSALPLCASNSPLLPHTAQRTTALLSLWIFLIVPSSRFFSSCHSRRHVINYFQKWSSSIILRRFSSTKGSPTKCGTALPP